MNIEELIKKASAGTITKAEVREVYRALVEKSGDQYDLLLILGRSEAKEYRNVVEGYLQSSHDPMVARLALQVLCRYWGLASEYEDELEEFIGWVDWDKEEDVRLMAIGCVADVYKKKESPKLLKHVYDVFKDETEDEITRGAAYETLAIVSGKSVNDLPEPMHFDIRSDVDPMVLTKVEEMIKKQLGSDSI